jgi:uncharacterized membrane protein
MIPDPLHPAMVHFPVALAALVPMLAVLAAFAIYRGWFPVRIWLAVVLLQGMLAGSAWVAQWTGENEEERVEKVVLEKHIEAHEDAADQLVLLAAATFGVSALGLLGGTLGTAGRIASLLAMAIVGAASVNVGRLGGELVYEHGAAQAYTKPGNAASDLSTQEGAAHEE